ncbi:MAG TPA: class I SAM-dependent methyltransferase [Thermoplasmata archaeon]|nr:class I SAM-dependent methyltransferase [Thermoplasmata archaeon]
MASPTSYARTIETLVRAIGDERALPDLEWVAHLAGATTERVSAVLEDLRRHLDDVASIRSSHASAGREFYAQICAPFELYALTRLLRPSHIVEAGVSSGVSSSHFLLGLLDNGAGALHSIDLPTLQKGPELGKGESPVSLPPDRSSGWAVPQELTLSWDLRIGPSEALLPGLVESLPAVDLFLHDDLHTATHLTFELEAIRPKLHVGSVVLADNTKWTGKAFDRFAASYGAAIQRRRGSDLVGIRVPPLENRPAAPARRAPRKSVPARRRTTGARPSRSKPRRASPRRF